MKHLDFMLKANKSKALSLEGGGKHTMVLIGKCRAHTVGNLSRIRQEQRTALGLAGTRSINPEWQHPPLSRGRCQPNHPHAPRYRRWSLGYLTPRFTLLLSHEFTHKEERPYFPLSSRGRLSAPTGRVAIQFFLAFNLAQSNVYMHIKVSFFIFKSVTIGGMGLAYFYLLLSCRDFIADKKNNDEEICFSPRWSTRWASW